MRKRKLISILILCILAPLVVVGGLFLAKGKQFYLVSLLIIALSFLPFLLSLERKKLQLKELVTLSVVIALSVASRAAFFHLPNVKPMCAILIMLSAAFGAEFGFVGGATAMLISNFIFGQGFWTPFQMLGMALTVFVSVLLLRAFKIKNSIVGSFVAGIISAVCCFVIYGLIVDLNSVLMMVTDFNIKSIVSIYVSGISFNAIHAVTTGIFVTLFYWLFNEKTERLKKKYGLFGEKK